MSYERVRSIEGPAVEEGERDQGGRAGGEKGEETKKRAKVTKVGTVAVATKAIPFSSESVSCWYLLVCVNNARCTYVSHVRDVWI